MAVDRLLPTQESEDLLELTREIADKELAPRVEEHERAETYPEGLFATLGEAGLLGLPYPEEVGGGGQPYEVYLQVLEELAARWAAVAVATSVHSLSCFPLFTFGTEEQKQRLPEMLAGGLIGGYSLSEPQAGSDAAALRCKAERVDAGYRITGTKAWITHGGVADFYALFARTGEGSRGVSCFLAPGPGRGPRVGQARGEDGPARDPHDDGELGRRGARRRPPDRRRGAGPADRVLRRWTPAGSGSPRARSGSRRARWTPPSTTPTSARRSARRSSTTRVSASCSPTWPRPSTRPARPTSTPRAAATSGVRTAARPAWPSSSPPTRR